MFNPQMWPSFQQSNPLITGIQTGQNIYQQQLMNQMRKQQAAMQPQMLQAQLAQRQAATESQRQQIEQSPRLLALKEKMADIAMQNADQKAAYNEIQRKKIPYYLGNVSARLAGTPFGQQLIGQDTNVMQNVLQGQANVAQQFGQGQQAHPMATPQSQPDNIAQNITASPHIADNIINSAQQSVLSKGVKDTTPTAIQQQRYYANTLNNISEKIDQQMPSISKYFGASGKLRLYKDKISAAAGSINPDYQKYYNFMTIEMPLYANEMKRALGGQATDSETKVMEDLINPDWNLANSEMAIKRFKELQSMENAIAGTLGQTGAQTLSEVKRRGMKQPEATKKETQSTVMMIDEQGNARDVPANQVQSAIDYGWSRA